ncbi:SAM-dependent methyltransferase [Bacillus sp. 1813sda1]|uniref:HsdM family class I SAM-dependent methyltransferase n=1 Tax=unclassified Bacillus (in: firmicutes) TaxID=185979 RepID=UPI00209D9508|nr:MULTISPECIES: N-6 DNA methylase [unclassified Bacillus (in: firmicutes)]MCP1166783.1 SAM-dependent methyltransferase [Bacillus sp. 1813sda1]MDC7973144.1 N-6 DNA methylase [Bacillus sp. BLCC-B18]
MKVRTKNNKIFSPILKKWIDFTPEELLRQQAVLDLNEVYGFEFNQMMQDYVVSIGSSKNNVVDLAVWLSEEDKLNKLPALILVECKLLNSAENLFSRTVALAIGEGASFFLLYENEQRMAYVVQKNHYERIVDIPSLRELKKEKSIISSIELVDEKSPIIERLIECHNVIRSMERMSPETAVTELNKLIFLKITNENIDLEILDIADDLINEMFKDAVHHPINLYNHIWLPKDKIELRATTSIEVMRILEKINITYLQATDYDAFLERVFKGEIVQHVTPRAVVKFMVSILNPLQGEVIGDPCVGTAGFLIEAMDYMRNQPKDLILYDRTQRDNTACYGSEINSTIARIAKMKMLINGYSARDIYPHDGLINKKGMFENRFDVLFAHPPIGGKIDSKLTIFPWDIDNIEEIDSYNLETFYGNEYLEAVERVRNSINQPILSTFDLGSVSNLTEVLFLERSLHLLKPGGRMGIILPNRLLVHNRLEKVRNYVESKAKILLLCTLPSKLFGTSIRDTTIIFLQRFSDVEENAYKNLLERITADIQYNYEQQDYFVHKNNRKYKGRLGIKVQRDIQEKIKKELDYTIPVVDLSDIKLEFGEKQLEEKLLKIVKEYRQFTNR